MKYEKPCIEVIKIQTEDIITISNGGTGNSIDLPSIGYDEINY